MKKFYEVVAVWTEEYEDSKGNAKEKKYREKYLVEANSVTEAESRTLEFLRNLMDTEVVSVNESRIIDIILKKS